MAIIMTQQMKSFPIYRDVPKCNSVSPVCKKCVYLKRTFFNFFNPQSWECAANPAFVTDHVTGKVTKKYTEKYRDTKGFVLCFFKNEHGDCEDFKEK